MSAQIIGLFESIGFTQETGTSIISSMLLFIFIS